MADMSISQAKQATAKSAADVFSPLEADAIETLQFWIGHGGRVLDGKAALDAAKYVLDKIHGKTPDQSSGQEPLWMKVMRRAVHVDGVPVENLPGMDEALGGTASGVVEEITFEFIWDEAS